MLLKSKFHLPKFYYPTIRPRCVREKVFYCTVWSDYIAPKLLFFSDEIGKPKLKKLLTLNGGHQSEVRGVNSENPFRQAEVHSLGFCFSIEAGLRAVYQRFNINSFIFHSCDSRRILSEARRCGQNTPSGLVSSRFEKGEGSEAIWRANSHRLCYQTSHD